VSDHKEVSRLLVVVCFLGAKLANIEILTLAREGFVLK